jgi:hypothetical protein
MSNLLEKASIITTPTAYSDGVLHSVKPSESPYADFTFTRNNPGTRVNASGNIESVGVDLPRINYEGGCGSWLLEPSRSNLQIYSEEFDNGIWNKTRASITPNDAISPSGLLDADKLVGVSGSSSYIFDGISVTSGDVYTISVFTKFIDINEFVIVNFTQSGNAYFNIENGTVISNFGTFTEPKIENYGNGWYRCSVKFTATATGNVNYGFFLNNAIDKSVHIWGAQIEVGSYATSYIPTTGSAVTRSADSATNAGSSDLISSTEGVLYLEVAALTSINNFESISLSNGGVDERIRFTLNSVENTISVQVTSGGSTVLFRNSTLSDITAFNKVAIKYKQDDYAIWINGVEEHSNITGAVPTLNELNFTSGGDVGNKFIGNVKCVSVFEEALTDAELTCLTTI